MSNNINNIRVNGKVTRKNKVYYNSNLSKLEKYTQPIVTFDLITRKTVHVTYAAGMTCMWDSISSIRMVKINILNHISQKYP